MKRGVILFDHGSRNDERNQLVIDTAASVRREFPEREIRHAFLDISKPTLPEAIDGLIKEGCQEITIQPFLLGPGRHLTEDLVGFVSAARQSHPEIEFQVTKPLGPDPKLVEIVRDRILSVSPKDS